MKKLFLTFCLSILLISTISALQFDNVKDIVSVKNPNYATIGDRNLEWNDLWNKYPTIKIENSFGLGKKLFEIALTEHTEVCENDYCYSKGVFYTSGDDPVYDEMNFYTKVDGSWKKQDVRSWSFKYWGSVDDYEYKCEDTGEVSINGTAIQECSNVKVGSHEDWIRLNANEKLPEGTYDYFLEARKKPSREVDWVMTSNGKALNELAIWGSIAGGDDAEVILNSPADGSIVYSTNVLFNASANVTGGATLVNMSLWNDDGGWSLKNSTDFVDKLNTNFSDGADYLITEPTIQTPTGLGWEVTFAHANVDAGAQDDFAGITPTFGTYYYRMACVNSPFTGNTLKIPINEGDWNTWMIWRLDDGSGNSLTNFGLTYYDSDDSSLGTESLPSLGTSWVQINGTAPTGTSYMNITFGSLSGTYGGSLLIDKINETGISSTQTWNHTISGDTIWNVQACDSDGDCGFATSNYTVILDATAPTIDILTPSGLNDYGTLGDIVQVNYSVTDTNLEDCWYDYNGTNYTIPSCNNFTITLEEGNYDITIYANDTVGNVGSDTSSWSYKVFENSRTFQQNVFEIDEQTFILNITTDEPTSTATFYYNGEAKTATKASGDNLIFTSTFDIPTISTTSNRSFYWQINYDGETINTDNSSQIVTDWNMSFDNTKQLINVTIYDEETLEIVNSTTLGVLANNWLGTGTYNISFSNSTELDGIFNIGVSDSGINNLNSDIWLYYSATGYQQRNFYETYLLSNSSIQQIDLYLLLADAGIINIYSLTRDYITQEEDVEVKAYKIEGGSETLVDMAITDGSGNANLFLDPDFTHRIVFEKTGCDTKELTQTPVGGTTTVKLECGVDAEDEINESVYSGLNIGLTPIQTSLTNGTQTFTTTVNDSNCYLSNILFYLQINGSTVNSTSSSESCGDILSLTRNIDSGEITAYIVVTKNETDITRSRIYTITNTGNLTGDMTSFWDVLTSLEDLDILGLSQKSKVFVSFIVLFLLIGFLSMSEGLKSENYWGLGFIWFYIFGVSYIGWFQLDLVNSSYIFSSFLNKYSLLILSSFILGGIGLIKSEN